MVETKALKKRGVPAGKVKVKQCLPEEAGAAEDRLAFISGFPGDGLTAEESLLNLFQRASVEAKELAEFQFEADKHPDWMRDRGNREVDPVIAMHRIEDVSDLLIERVFQWASASSETDRGRWAGRFLAELANRLIAESPGLKVEWKDDRITHATALSGNRTFVDRLRALRTRGPGKKNIKARGADAARFVLETWKEALETRQHLLLKVELERSQSERGDATKITRKPVVRVFSTRPADAARSRDAINKIENRHNALLESHRKFFSISPNEMQILNELSWAETALRTGKPDRDAIARKVFSDLLADMLESRWDEGFRLFPDMAAGAQSAANRKGMKSAFSAKRDNLRDAWLSIALGEYGLNRLLP